MEHNPVVSAFPHVVDTCPPVLRSVLERWKHRQATTAELQEATFTVALDDLEAMRYQPAPVVPEAVLRWRALAPSERKKVSAEDQAAFDAKHAGFFACERQRALENLANRPFLTQMLAWAEAGKPHGVVLAIKQALSSHLIRDEG